MNKSYGVAPITDQAGRGAIYQAQNPPACHLADRGITVIAYRGPDSDPYATKYDHDRGEFAEPLHVGTNPLSNTDNHGPPSMCVDDDGIIYLFYGAHNDSIQVARSAGPGRIDAWHHGSPIESPGGSYPQPVVIDNELYVFLRAGNGHGPPYDYPQHEYGTIVHSSDQAEMWQDLGPVIDTSDHPDEAIDAYVMDGDVHRDRFHLTWCIAHGERHDAVRSHVFHAVFDPTDRQLYGIDGTAFGDTITWADMDGSVLQAFDGHHASGPKHAFDGKQVYITTTYLPPSTDLLERWVTIWDGDSWTAEAVPGSRTNHMYSGCSPRINDDGALEVHAITGSGRTTTLKGKHRGGSFEIFTLEEGQWDQQLVRAGDTGSRPLSRLAAVRDGQDDLASIVVEASNDPTEFDLTLFGCGTEFQ